MKGRRSTIKVKDPRAEKNGFIFEGQGDMQARNVHKTKCKLYSETWTGQKIGIHRPVRKKESMDWSENRDERLDQIYLYPWTAQNTRIYARGSKDPRTAESVQIFKGECRDTSTADSVRL